MDKPSCAWRFRCLKSERGEDLIDRWKGKNLSKKATAKLERALEYLCVRPKSEWARPHASPLGNHIYVIRFSDENRAQLRVAGHFHGETRFFVMTQPAVEKDDKYDPENLTELANNHKNTCDTKFNDRTQECFYLDIHRDEDERATAATSTIAWRH